MKTVAVTEKEVEENVAMLLLVVKAKTAAPNAVAESETTVEFASFVIEERKIA